MEDITEQLVDNSSESVVQDSPVSSNTSTDAKTLNTPDPIELQLVDFEHGIVACVNNFLNHNSAILISPFMNQVAADIDKLAQDQTTQLVKKFRS